MTDRANLLFTGSFEQGWSLYLEIKQVGRKAGCSGFLPANPNLINCYKNWLYSFHLLLKSGHVSLNNDWQFDDGLPQQVAIQNPDVLELCQLNWEQLKLEFLSWLTLDTHLQKIEILLSEQFSRHPKTSLLIQSDDQKIWKLPWYEWKLLQRYSQVGISYSLLDFQSIDFNKIQNAISSRVNLLAVFGNNILANGETINLAHSKEKIKKLEKIKLDLLEQPSSEQLRRYLRNHYQIFFFTGHSGAGRFYLNQNEKLSIEQLSNFWREANQYLQIVIFNSCDGVNLARSLLNLNVAFVIVMQEEVPAVTAELFLQEFLREFTNKQSLATSVRKAQELLQNPQLPGVELLPLLVQNPTAIPPNYTDLYITDKPISLFRKVNKILGVSLILTLLILLLRYLGFFETAEMKGYDFLMQKRQAELIDSRIVVVEITNQDLGERGFLGLEDGTLAKLVNKIAQGKPQSIGLDLHRHTPRGKGREEFIQTLKNQPNFFLVCAYSPPSSDYNPPAELTSDQISEKLGFSNFYLDELDQKVRRQLLTYNPNRSPEASKCSTPYSLSFQLAYQFLYSYNKPLQINPNKDWYVGQTVFQKLTRNFGGYQSLDGQSNQIMINYRSLKPPGQKVSLKPILDDAINPNLFKDKIVLIGYTAEVANDHFETPIGRIAGVWIHAHMISQMLSSVLDQRPLIWVLPQWGNLVWILFWSIVGGVLAECWIKSKKWVPLIRVVGLALILSICCYLLYQVCIFALEQGLWVPFIPSAFILLFSPIIFYCLRRV